MDGRCAAKFAAAMGAAMTLVVGCGDGSTFEVAPSPSEETGDETTSSDATPDTESDAAPDTARDDTRADSLAPPDTMHDDTLVDSAAARDSLAEAEADADAIEVTIDSDAEVSVDAPVDAPCETPVFCYVDADGDSYVVTAGAFAACGACPSGSRAVDPTTTKFDCDDFDPSVHPGVTTFETTPYCVPGTGCAVQSFDYDCDGVETKEWTALASVCATSGSACTGDGWTSATAPACGTSGGWQTCTRDLLSCKSSTVTIVQGCR